METSIFGQSVEVDEACSQLIFGLLYHMSSSYPCSQPTREHVQISFSFPHAFTSVLVTVADSILSKVREAVT